MLTAEGAAYMREIEDGGNLYMENNEDVIINDELIAVKAVKSGTDDRVVVEIVKVLSSIARVVGDTLVKICQK